MRAGPSGELAEMEFESFIKDLADQRALARARDTCDAGPHPQWNFDVDVFQVVCFGAADCEPVRFRESALRAKSSLGRAEIYAGRRIRMVFDFLRRANGDDAAAAHACARSQIDD